jgi:hypothetical protein
VAVGQEVARAVNKQLESFKQAQRSGFKPKRFQHGTLGVKYENVKCLIHPRKKTANQKFVAATGWLGSMYGVEGCGISDGKVAAQVQPEIEMATVASLPAAVARPAARAPGEPVNPFTRPLVDHYHGARAKSSRLGRGRTSLFALHCDLPAYVAAASGFSIDHGNVGDFTEGILGWWKSHASEVGAWGDAALIAFAMAPNSAGAERVFSLLKILFGNNQETTSPITFADR